MTEVPVYRNMIKCQEYYESHRMDYCDQYWCSFNWREDELMELILMKHNRSIILRRKLLFGNGCGLVDIWEITLQRALLLWSSYFKYWCGINKNSIQVCAHDFEMQCICEKSPPLCKKTDIVNLYQSQEGLSVEGQLTTHCTLYCQFRVGGYWYGEVQVNKFKHFPGASK